MYNLSFRPIRTWGYDTAEREVELTHARNIHQLRLRLTANVSVAGGTTDGTLVQDGILRLIRSVRVNHDGFDYVEPISARSLWYLQRRVVAQPVAPTTLTSAGVQTNTAIALDLIVPFTSAYLANPYDVFLPAMPVTQQLKLFVQLETGTTTAASSPGSSALITGGDRNVTITNLLVDVVEVSSAPSGLLPQYIPVITNTNSDQFTTANSELEIELRQSRRVALQLLQYRMGPAENLQAGINRFSLVAGNVRIFDAVTFAQLKSYERATFLGVPADETGTIVLDYLDNGRLGSALDPKRMGANPRYLLDVATPTTSPGRIHVVGFELAVRPGWTAVETA